MFSDFIKHYNSIRRILRDVFLYGCFSKEELENKSVVSARKVSYEIRRIQQYIQKDFIKIDQLGRNKLLSLSYDSIKNTNNFLVNTYLSKSFTKADITLYFYLLLILNTTKEPLTFGEIEDELIVRNLIDYEEISSKTIERKIKEMCDIGVIGFVKKGRSKAYIIAEDILGDLNNEEVNRLYLVQNLYKNLIYPTIAGYYCEDTIKDYMKFERGIDIVYDDCFQYKNLHFHPIIEEELLWKCIKAINEKHYIIIEIDENLYRYNKNSREQVLKPAKIRYDSNHGRFYLVSFNNSNRCVVSRLDRVDNIIVKKETFGDTDLEERYLQSMKRSWSSVPNHNNRSFRVVIKVVVKEPEDMYILGKIKNEMKSYNEEIVGEGEYILERQVSEPTEMIPWLRSYGSYVKVLEPKSLATKLRRDWRKALDQYGVI